MDEGKPLPDEGGGGASCEGGSSEGGSGILLLWSCLDDVPQVDAACGDDLSFQFQFSGEELATADVDVKVCNRADTPCDAPSATIAPNPNTGDLFRDVPPNFTGYFDIDSDSYRAALLELGPLTGLPRPKRYVPLLTEADIEQALTDLQTEELTDRGHIVLLATDCDGNAAPGISIQADNHADSSSTYFYLGSLIGLTVDPNASATNYTGGAGIVNLEPGQTTVRTIRNGETVGKATVLVRPGELTYIHLGPTPQ